MRRGAARLIPALLVLALAGGPARGGQAEESAAGTPPSMAHVAKATFAGGCFWCLEGPFDQLEGVLTTTAGYTGGQVPNPTYEQVSSGTTGHAEALEVTFDPSKVIYEQLLDVFWRNIDPTDPHGQFADQGSQYRTAIFYHSEDQRRLAEASKEALAQSGKFDRPVATTIAPAGAFYPAEDYHQEYYKKYPFRYQLYREGSGRATYLRRVWGADH